MRVAVACSVVAAGVILAGMRSGIPETVDPELRAVIEQYQAMNPKPLIALTADQARLQPLLPDAMKVLLRKQGKSTSPEPVGRVENRTVEGADGELGARVYTPVGQGPFPVVVYFHGGGWVLGSPETHDASARALTNAANAVVISVDYRRAPEHRFPAAAEDAYASTQWALKHTAAVNGRPGVVAVAGESAGGNLATVACLMARDRRERMPVHQLLIYPVTFAEMRTASYDEFAEGPVLTRPMMVWFWRHYLGDRDAYRDPYASPLYADVRGLPPATVITAGHDVLRDEGHAYAERLIRAGVAVGYRNYASMTHEFFGLGAMVEQAREAARQAGSDLKLAFSTSLSR